MLIGQALRLRREKAQLSQEDAAKGLDINVRTLSRWEHGEGSLWTGGDAGCVDHALMERLKVFYSAAASELMPRNQYPCAPLDPALRREFMRRRNAAVAGIDTDEYLATLATQDERVARHGAESVKS
jgi:transcriptional regulator with XRE-family HTH domain